MKIPLSFALFLAGFCLALSGGSLRADDWKTTDGKTYQNVSVVKAEPDAVTITHQDGGALVPLNTLPPDIQKRFNYDPATAKTAADARAQANTKNAAALQTEMNQAEARHQAALVASDPRHPTPGQPVVKTVAMTTVVSPNRPNAPFNPMADASGDAKHRAPVETSDEIKKQALADAIKQLSSGNSTLPLSPDVLSSLQALANDPSQLAAALPPDPSSDPQPESTPSSTAASPTTSTQVPTPVIDDPNPLNPARGPNMHSTSDLADITVRLKDDHPSDNHNSTSSLLRSASNLNPPANDPTHHSTDSLLNGDPLSNRQ